MACKRNVNVMYISVTICLCTVSFYCGILSGINTFSLCDEPIEQDSKIEAIVQQRVQAELSKAGNRIPGGSKYPRFDKTVRKFATGVARVSKEDFAREFDYGSPTSKSEGTGEAEALIFYASNSALPSRADDAVNAQYESGNGIPLLNVTSAFENCQSVNVITTSTPGNTRQCMAIVGNYESYHIQKWMRVPMEKGKLDNKLPLRAVSRGQNKEGGTPFKVPSESDIKNHWAALHKYFDNLDKTLAELGPIAERVAKDNVIIIMTCNMGQSELLMNFVCNTRSRGLDISNVLVFPTDIETKKLAEGMGLTTFFDFGNFEKMPQGEAKRYGDSTFVAMMFAKVVCVQLINHLGYDLLFQDVDLVWYKNPLDYFRDSSTSLYNFDMYFQDDGSRSSRYAPMSANSGFYYVRNNEKTRYFFTSLLYAGDLIIKSHSHQQAMIQLMAEHSSLFGLRVKVLNRDMEEFPGGWHYHSRSSKDFMKQLMNGNTNTQIFHMSWTKNKDNKVKFFQQMGEWYLAENCISKTKDSIVNSDSLKGSELSSLMEQCCLVQPEVKCHYSDKPSKKPCKESNPIDKGGKSFW